MKFFLSSCFQFSIENVKNILLLYQNILLLYLALPGDSVGVRPAQLLHHQLYRGTNLRTK